MMNWRKWISTMMAIVMFMSFSVIGHADTDGDAGTDVASNSMRVGSVEGYPGEIVNVPVYMTPQDLINQLDISIGFDDNSLELVPDHAVTYNPEVLSSSGDYTNNLTIPGTIGIKANPVFIMDGEVEVFTLQFKIKDSAQPGTMDLNVLTHVLYEGEDIANTTAQNGTITVKAVSTPKHTVTFNTQGGSVVASVTNVESGSTISPPSAPTKAGYTFGGWYKDIEGTENWNFTTDTVTSNVTLFAKWEFNVARINFYEASGTPGSIVEVPVAVMQTSVGIGTYQLKINFDPQSLAVTKITGHSGNTFIYNYHNGNGVITAMRGYIDGGNTPILAGDKLFTISFKIKEEAELGDKLLRYDYTAPENNLVFDMQGDTIEGFLYDGKVTVSEPTQQHTVSFDSQGGTEVANLTNVTSGTTIAAPSAPTKAGYTFGGWYKDIEGIESWNFASDTVTSDVTLYAKWEGNVAHIDMGAVSGTPGSTVQVPVTLTQSSIGVAGYQLRIVYNTEALEVANITGNSGEFFSSNFNNNEGWVKAAWVDSEGGDTPILAGEKLFTISFKIKAQAELGDKFLVFNYVLPEDNLLLDAANNNIQGFLNLGKVTVNEGPVQHTVSFDSQGGTEVAALTNVTSGTTITAPLAPTKVDYTFAGWYKDIAGTTAWNFAVDQVTADVTLYAKWTKNDTNNPSNPSTPGNPSNPGNSNPGTPATTPTTVTPEKPVGFQVIIDGVVKEQVATGSTSNENGKSVLTATVDQTKLADQLKQAGDKTTVIIPVTTSVNKVSVVLTGEAVKSMENKQAVLEVQTPNGIYKLPAGQIAIDNVSSKLGEQIKLSDIVIHVDIAESDETTASRAQTAATRAGFEVATLPVTFSVIASYNGKIVGVEQFSSYVERDIPLPADVDLSKVTTAAVLNPDGSVRHVPTYITNREGKNYAVVNSLTNSDYFLLWNPKTFADVEGHWSKQAVNDMASRLIIKGTDDTHYGPDAAITRAELTAIMIRGLGLSDIGGETKFNDVKSSDWYAGAIAKAVEYDLIEGYENGTFAPNQSITRQEALAIMNRAMKLAGLEAGTVDTASLLSPFADQAIVAPWAKQAMATAVKSGLVKGSAEGLRPTANLTRGETAALVQRLLIAAKLIDNKNAN